MNGLDIGAFTVHKTTTKQPQNQYITGYFYNEMRYMNLRITYLLTYTGLQHRSEQMQTGSSIV